jgi:acyl carrier protein
MGLDIVELVIRTEEVFGITIENSDAEKIRTVGDLYQLVCKLLNVSPTPDPGKLIGIHHPPSRYGPLSQHTAEDIWVKIVVTIQDQLQVDVTDIRYNAHFQNDLGAD